MLFPCYKTLASNNGIKRSITRSTCAFSPVVGRHVRLVSWMHPPLGWYKLNTDGSYFGNLDLCGNGGVIRDA